jgi:hypothetical protein
VIIVSKKHSRGEKGNKNIGSSIPSENTALSIDVFNTNFFNIIKIY